MVNIAVCYYRDWGREICENVERFAEVNVVEKITSHEEYKAKIDTLGDRVSIILFVGWSWFVSSAVTSKYLCIGIHPSALPEYRGGSPIQNQIINGIVDTKITLMVLSDKEVDTGEILEQEPVSFAGDNLDEVFKNIIASSTKALIRFFYKYPNYDHREQRLDDGSSYPRRKPNDSKLTLDMIKENGLEWTYNFIRSLTDPYPNAYFEDDQGNKLLINGVKYIPNSKK